MTGEHLSLLGEIGTWAATGAVLAALAGIAVVDARRLIIDPRLIAALVLGGVVWRLCRGASEGGDSLLAGSWGAALMGAAIGVVVVVAPIAYAAWRGLRWPLFPGDAMMLGAFGFVLGPLGLGWAMLFGAAFAGAHRICLQRRRGRPVGAGYAPLGPGMAAGAAVVFVGLNAGIVLAADEAAKPAAGLRQAPVPAPVVAVELAPLGAALPAELAAREIVLEGRLPLAFAALARRIGAAAGVGVAIEERPSRIVDGRAILADPPVLRPAFRGALANLLDRVAVQSGYDWEWRGAADGAGELVFFRYWDHAQRPAASPSEASPWHVDTGAHTTLRSVLEDWADLADWSLVWKPERRYTVTADATFTGEFLEAVDMLLADGATRRALVARAYKANRYLVIEEAGAVWQ